MNLDTITYEQYFGLSLAIGRVQGRRTFSVFQALCAANARKLPASFFEPVSSSREEAEDRAFDFNAQREVQRAMRDLR